ncbi:MAG: acylneuraminate cytidylyltransferase family protein [Methylophilaceae bacterium]|nr:acylneuraminate cytidylyltransferase family protein [Methylophilaceae bacterium]
MINTKILGVIPARAGSKGIPNKNIIEIGDQPLIKYTIDAALGSTMITDCIVSTDSNNIASLAESLGSSAPFIRPKNLSDDKALSLPVIQHAVNFMEKKHVIRYDAVIMLQPTTPLRTSEDIDKSLSTLMSEKLDSVISVVEVEGNHPLRMKRIVNNRLVNYIDQGHEDMRPRQELPQVYIRNGAIYATLRDVLIDGDSFVGENSYPYVMSKEKSINIDTLSDLYLAKTYINNAKNKL